MDAVGANPGRSGHRLSIDAGRILYEAREAIALLFNIDDPLGIAFTKNATEALNMALFGLLRPGDHVITSCLEHNSVARPLRYLEQQGVELTALNLHQSAEAARHLVRSSIKPNTRAIVVNHASNVTGAIAPLAAINHIAREHGLVTVVDAAQTAGAYPVSVDTLGIDLLAFTGHKSLLGPQGTGGLYVRPGVELRPFILGGTGSSSESDRQPHFMPDYLESGTPNTVGFAGLLAAIGYIRNIGLETITGIEDTHRRYFVEGLRNIEGVRIHGDEDGIDRTPTVSITITGLSPSEVGFILDDEFGIMVRVGLHCSPWAHEHTGTYPSGTVRFGLGVFTTKKDIDHTLCAIDKIASRGTG